MKSNIEFLYEELRKATDGGSESMTHDDALKQIAYWRDKCSQAQAVEPIGYIRHADKTFWPHPECAVYASVSPSLAPVYAHPAPPAQQVAVPMTEAQIFECDPVPHVMFDQQRIDFARAIEAFHGVGAKPC